MSLSPGDRVGVYEVIAPVGKGGMGEVYHARDTKLRRDVAIKVLQPGTGTRHPRPNSTVTVHYTGWSTDGKTFDSSVTRGEPATFSVDGVIPGWTEALQMMVEGEKRRLWIPANLAYEGQPDKPQGMLVFDVELIRIDS